jgi:phosphonate transport system substrate-binding protein
VRLKGASLISVVLAALLAGVSLGYLLGLRWPSTPQETIVLAIQPTEAAAEISPRATELERFLEERTGLNIEIYIPTTYASVIEALQFGRAHVAMMSAWPSLLAHVRAQAEVGLAEVREVLVGSEKREAPFYFSYWVVRADSPFKALEELRGKRVCFPSPLSTSGYVFPMARLVERGLVVKVASEADPKMFFSEVLFGGGYAQCWAALKAGQVDVTVIAGDVSAKLYNEVLANTRVLDQQGPIPSHAVVFSKDLKPEVRDKLVKAFLELGREEHRDLMRKLVSAIFVRFEATTTERHLTTLRAALQLTGLKYVERLG